MSTEVDRPARGAAWTPKDEAERESVIELCVRGAVASASDYGFNLFSEKIRPTIERIVPKVPPKFRRVPLDGTRELGVAALGDTKYPIVFNIYTHTGQPSVSMNSPYSFRALLETAHTDEDRFMLARAACELQACPHEGDAPLVAGRGLRELSDAELGEVVLIYNTHNGETCDSMRAALAEADKLRGVSGDGERKVYGYAACFDDSDKNLSWKGGDDALRSARAFATGRHKGTVHPLYLGGPIAEPGGENV